MSNSKDVLKQDYRDRHNEGHLDHSKGGGGSKLD